MISHIKGRVAEKRSDSIIVDVNGLSYEVLLPSAVMNSLDSMIDREGNIKLVTYHYYQMDPSRCFPVLIGFFYEIEKDFFGKFITVSGVGPKAAVRALSLPIPAIAKAIHEGDIKTLKSLSGIGEQRAREIVAKLQGKIGKYGLMKEGQSSREESLQQDFFEEAVEILLQLQYTKAEAANMVKLALEQNPKLKSSEDVLNEVYKQKIKTG